MYMHIRWIAVTGLAVLFALVLGLVLFYKGYIGGYVYIGGREITVKTRPQVILVYDEAADTVHLGPQIFRLDGENASNITLENWSEPPRMLFRFAKGTQESPEGLTRDDLFGWIVWQSYDPEVGEFRTLGNIEMRVEEPPSGKNAIPGAMSFWTTNGRDTSGSPYSNAEKLRILHDGTLVVGSGDGEDHTIGERGSRPVAGGTIRSPDLAPGKPDLPGADLTLAAGLGTGQGRPGRIIFQVPTTRESGTELQPRSSVMVLDGDAVKLYGTLELQGVRLTADQLQRLLELIED